MIDLYLDFVQKLCKKRRQAYQKLLKHVQGKYSMTDRLGYQCLLPGYTHTHTHTHTHIPHVCVQYGRSYRHIMEGGVGEIGYQSAKNLLVTLQDK